MVIVSYDMGFEIGINPVTVLVTTILGIPGLAMLYGIKIVSLL